MFENGFREELRRLTYRCVTEMNRLECRSGHPTTRNSGNTKDVSSLSLFRSHGNTSRSILCYAHSNGAFNKSRSIPAAGHPPHRCAAFRVRLVRAQEPSLLAFDVRRRTGNLQKIYGIDRVPPETRLREILDPVDPNRLRSVLQEVFRALQRGNALDRFVFHDGA